MRESLGLTQADAGLLVGGGPMAFSKYERGEVSQSVAMDRFLRILAIYPFAVDTLRQMVLGEGSEESVGGYQSSESQPLRCAIKSRILEGTRNVVVPDCWKSAA